MKSNIHKVDSGPKMRIAYLWVSSSGSVGSGSTNHIRHWLSGLDNIHYDPALITCYEPISHIRDYFMEITHLEIISSPLLDTKSKLFIPGAIQLARTLRDGGFQILHTVGFKSDLLGWLSSYLYKPDLLLSSIEGYPGGVATGRLRLGIFKILYRLISTRVDQFIAITNQTAIELINEFGVHGDMVKVIRSGICPGNYQMIDGWYDDSSHKDRNPRFGFLGRIAPEKAIDDFVMACAEIYRRCPGASFHIGGDGPHKSAVMEKFERLNLHSNLKFHGWVHDTREFFKSIDALLVPALPQYDGLPWVILEAMATGVPVVAMDGGGIREVVKNNVTGLLVKPGDVVGMASKALGLFDQPSSAHRMAQLARASIEDHFSSEREIEELVCIYSKGLARGVS